MELELKHLAPYLPYNTRVISKRGTVFLLDTYSNIRGKGIESRDIQSVLNEQMKLILRPLSDLTKEIEYNGQKFVPIKKLGINKMWLGINDYHLHLQNQPYSEVQQLIEWHFDIFGLIESGQAIDINTLNK